MFVWLLWFDFDLKFQLLTLYISALVLLRPLKMTSHTNPFQKDEAAHPGPLYLAGLQPSTWSFNHPRQGRVTFDASSVIGRHTHGRNGKTLGRRLDFSQRSLTFSDHCAKRKTGVADTNMLDAPNAANQSTFERSTRQPSFPADGDLVVSEIHDGGFVEVIHSTTSNADSGLSNIYMSPIPLGTGTQTIRPPVPGNSTFRRSDSRSYLQSRTQPHCKVDQGQGKITAYLSPKPSNQEPDVQILDAAIARRFPVFSKDSLDDAAFEYWMKANAPRSIQEINEDDDAAVEDFAEEDFIVDHLRSLVITPSTGASSNSVRKTPWTRQADADVVKGLKLRRGVTVELQNGSFLWIDSVRENFWGSATIRGYRLARDGYCGAKLPCGRTNELVLINEIHEEGHRAGQESVFQEVQVCDVKRVRQVVYTNCPWPIFSFDSELKERGGSGETFDEATALKHGKLYCRWKYNQVNSRLKTDVEACLTLLCEKEAIGRGGLEASILRKEWRGDEGPIRGGRSTKFVFDVETGKTISLRQYNLGDCFCGAGGISRGAVQAGLKVAWGFDGDADAVRTHAENFAAGGTQSLELKDDEMIDLIKAEAGKYNVDIVHYSPPCQPFSSANHNKNIERDFANQKTLFSLHDLTELLKPRIATIEETAGLMHRHQQWFDTLIHIFTNLGYSVRWKIVRCREYGIPQSRVRLLLMAAA